VLQAYELGESHPPALARRSARRIERLTAEAEATMTETLSLLSQTYNRLRVAWSAPPDDALHADALLADLPPLTRRLRDQAALFSPTAALHAAGSGRPRP
jgi:hypothetical protein